MQKNCKKCNLNFEITNSDLEFYKKISPKFWDKVFEISTPTLCPECRQQRRLVFRNERKLYKRKCDATGESIISMYSPDKNFKVYNSDFWWSDKWNPLDYGKDFDFGKSFFEQFRELISDVPKMSVVVLWNDNSPYVNYVGNSNNIYMSWDVLDSENLYYSNMIKKVKNGLDLYDIQDSEECYESMYSQRLYNCKYVNWSADCKNSSYLFRCYNLDNCLFCFWLSNKKNHIFNIPYTKEKYIEIKNRIVLWESNDLVKKYFEKIKSIPKQFCHLRNVENSSWDILKNVKNSQNCYQSIELNNCKNVLIWFNMNDCMDTSIHNPNCFLDYEAISWGELKNAIVNNFCWYCNNIYYSFECLYSNNLFWCTWLKNKQYCIFNKQYTKEEYNKLVPKIIEKMKIDWEWWEFFPASLSPFWYNETVAGEYFPLNKEEIINQNFNYSEYEAPFPKVEKIIPANKLPENISDIPDDILNWAIECEISKKPFRIIKPELEFYRKHNLPIPHKHPDVRHFERMKLRNPRKLFDRKCDKCGVEMKSTYSADRDEIVYCEGCYEKEVY